MKKFLLCLIIPLTVGNGKINNIMIEETKVDNITISENSWKVFSHFLIDAKCVEILNLSGEFTSEMTSYVTSNIYKRLKLTMVYHSSSMQNLNKTWCDYWTQGYFIIAKDLLDIEKQLNNIDLKGFWFERASLITVLTEEKECTVSDTKLKQVFETVWNQHRIVRLLICVYRCVQESTERNANETLRVKRQIDGEIDDGDLINETIHDNNATEQSGRGNQTSDSDTINVNRTTTNSTSVSDLILFTYEPFGVNSSGAWGIVRNHTTMQALHNPRVVEPNINNMNGYPFRAVLFSSPMLKLENFTKNTTGYVGVDVCFLEQLQESMNFSTKVINAERDKYGYILNNGTTTGGVGYVVRKEAEISNALYFIKDYGSDLLEFSSGVFDDKLCVVVRTADRVPNWTLIIRCFSPIVWVGVLLLYLALWGMWVVFRYFPSIKPTTELSKVALNALAMLVQASVELQPRHGAERVFLVSAAATCLTLVGVFQGLLVTVYSTPTFYPPIDTLLQVADSKLKIQTRSPPLLNDVFLQDSDDEVTKKLRTAIVLQPANSDPDKEIAAGHAAGFSRLTQAELTHDARFFLPDGTYLLHVVKQCPRTYTLAYVLPRASVISRRVDILLLRSLAAGLTKKWYAQMALNNTLQVRKEARMKSEEDDSYSRKFSLADLYVAFWILIAGNIISIMIFINEIFVGKGRCHFGVPFQH